jgi:hypothetical protein
VSQQQQALLSATSKIDNETQPALSTLNFGQLFQKENLDTLNGKVNALFAGWWKKLGFCSKFGSLSALVLLCGNFSTHNGILGFIFILLTLIGLTGTLGFLAHWSSFKKKERLHIINQINAFSYEDKQILKRVLSIIILKDVHEDHNDKDYAFEYPEEFITLAQSEHFFLDAKNYFHCRLIDELNHGDLVDQALRECIYQNLTQEELLQMIHGYLPDNLENKVKKYQELKKQPQIQNHDKSQINETNSESEDFKGYL